MPRLARILVPGLPHHITHRGNHKDLIYREDEDRKVYLRLLVKRCTQHSIAILSYCLMTNHVHLVAIPEREDSLSKGLRDAHGLYASYFNRKYNLMGHLWQGRFYSCTLDEVHLWAAIRYVERNPVRAGIVNKAASYPWSSAPAHCGLREDLVLSELVPPTGLIRNWSSWLAQDEGEEKLRWIREKTKTGRPLASDAFVEQLESQLGRPLRPRKGGRPRRKQFAENQGNE